MFAKWGGKPNLVSIEREFCADCDVYDGIYWTCESLYKVDQKGGNYPLSLGI